jgi:hypothetical protein
MTPKKPQCEVFWPFNSSSELLRVLEDSKFPLLGVWASPSHLAQNGVATPMACCKTCIKPSIKLVIANNIGLFFLGVFSLKVFNLKILKGYYVFWIVKKMVTL